MNKEIINNKIKKHKKIDKIIFSDIETIIINNTHYPYAIGWNDDKLFKYEYANNIEEILNYTVINNFLERLKIYYNKTIVIYYHNMSNFDGFIILKTIINNNIKPSIIERNNVIYEIKFNIDNNTIIIRDSLLIIPMSLKKIGETFSEIKKKEYPIQNINENNWLKEKEDILIYLKYDVMVLKEGFNKFHSLIYENFNYNIYESLSLSSISFNIFRTVYYNIEEYPIYKNTYSQDFFIRESYYGGITECYKPHLKNGYYYDVNSLYPYCMTKELPIGKGVYKKDLRFEEIENLYGFINCDIITPKEMNIPFLPIKYNKMLITPLGKFNGTYFSEELKYAKKLGYKIQPIKGVLFKKGYPLKKFSIELYNYRKGYKKSNPMNTIIKLILNSLYGRFGMKIDIVHNKYIEKNDYEKYLKKYQIKNVNVLNNNMIHIEYYYNSSINKKMNKKQKIMKDYDINTAVHIASAITAYSRIHMYEFKKENCYYTDTDSIFTDKPLKKSLIGDELGKMKLECEIKEAIFLAPKNYIYIDIENNEKIVFKGVNKKENLNMDFYKNFLSESGEFIWNRETYFKKNYTDLTIHKHTYKIVNKIPFLKRAKIIKNNIWIDTEPLSIEQKLNINKYDNE